MNTAIEGVSIAQAAAAIAAGGKHKAVIVTGAMGEGKTQGIAAILKKQFPKHVFIQLDTPSLDLGDLMIPKFMDMNDKDYVRFVPNEMLGLHLDQPVIINLDEIGKANASIKNALRPILVQRMLNGVALHPDSIVYGTTNLDGEGLGDMLMPHQRNSVAVLKLRKSTNLEWIQWGAVNDIDPLVLGWVKEEPALFQSFEEVNVPSDNPYIYHPREHREPFVTGRSLASASYWVSKRDELDSDTLTGLLVGTIGAPAAFNLMTFIKMASSFPSLESIKQDPFTAVVPSKINGQCYVMFRALAAIEADWVDAWMDYSARLNPEVQAVFASALINRSDKDVHPKQKLFTRNKKFSDWTIDNVYIFQADKR